MNIVLLTAMATVGAYIYNLSTDIVGGVEVTLADRTDPARFGAAPPRCGNLVARSYANTGL